MNGNNIGNEMRLAEDGGILCKYMRKPESNSSALGIDGKGITNDRRL
jgi:hypothetical protein